MKAIDAVIENLRANNAADAEKIVVELGNRHKNYGAEIEHFPVNL